MANKTLKNIAIIGIVAGVFTLITGMQWKRGYGFVDVPREDSIFWFILGFVFYISSYFLKTKKYLPEHTKCPKCKDTFNYKDTLEGKCPNCKDVDTIDIKEYYEKFPDEKDV